MNTSEANKRIAEIYEEIGQLFIAQVQEEMQGKLWSHAVSDRRFGPEGGSSSIGKYRIVLPDATSIGLEYIPGAGPLIIEAFNVRKTHLPQPEWWYGVLLTVYPDGTSKCEFNYDPLCIRGFDLKS